jgi:hypothetical protein
MWRFCIAFIALNQSPPGAADQQRILRTLTAFARSYLDHLPDFTCTRTTQHLLAAAATKDWKAEATVAYELSYYGREEHYDMTTIDGVHKTKVPARTMAKGWFESSGNFGLTLGEIFDPEVHTDFQWNGGSSLDGKRTFVFSYRVPLANSKSTNGRCVSWIAFKTCKTLKYGYHGLIVLDADSLDIRRLTIIPDDLPVSHGQWTQTIDYTRTTVGGGQYLLPAADSFEITEPKTLFRNESTYGSYKKFTADSALIPAGSMH